MGKYKNGQEKICKEAKFLRKNKITGYTVKKKTYKFISISFYVYAVLKIV